VAGVIPASEPSSLIPFTGLSPRCFGKLVTGFTVRPRTGHGAIGRGACHWKDPVLLSVANWRTNLTLRQLAPL
jgi:hypothetical protein